MGMYVSPGVYTKELDLSTLVSSLSTTIGAIVGASAKGDASQVKLVTNTQEFINEYGEPATDNYFHYSALAFLENGNQLYCLRVVNTDAYYGGVKIKTSVSAQANAAIASGATTNEFVQITGEDNLFYVYGANQGAWNNSIGVRITNISETAYTFTIEVYYLDSNGTYQKVESWNVSREHRVDGFGNQLYLEDVINGYSDYISVADSGDLYAYTILPKAQATTLAMATGADGTDATESQIATGWDEFANPDDVDVRILIGAGHGLTVQAAMKTIAEDRKDCIALFDVPLAETSDVTSTTTWRTTTQNYNSSYCALYSPWVKIYDQYNGVIVTVPPSGYVASQMAYNDYVANVWSAPAGMNRGLMNVLSVTPVYTQGNRDTLYTAGVNPLQTFRGAGNVIWGQKTEQTTDSALNRINVRRLLITLEKSISATLQYFVFELNNEATRFRIVGALEQYLDQLSAGGAFETSTTDTKGYSIVCDETNNTPATIDRNEMHVDVFVKPVRVAEFIQLQVIITPTAASFTELVARGVNL